MGESQGCPYQGAFDLLSRRHVLAIVWLLQQRNPRRFTEIKTELRVNPVTLTQRLCDLEEAEILTRRVFSEVPPRVEYRLTAKGEDLVDLMEKVCAWACRWDPDCAEKVETASGPPAT